MNVLKAEVDFNFREILTESFTPGFFFEGCIVIPTFKIDCDDEGLAERDETFKVSEPPKRLTFDNGSG